MSNDEAIDAIRNRRPEDNITTLLRAANLPQRWTHPVTIGGREYQPEREAIYVGCCPTAGVAHKLRAEYPRWESRKREYALDQRGRRKRDQQREYIVKRDRITQEAWMGRIRCEYCGQCYNVNNELVYAFADDLAAYDQKNYAGSMLATCGPAGDWGAHNERPGEAEEQARRLAADPPPKRRML